MSWKNVQYENGKMRTSEGGGGGGSSTFAGLDDVSFSDLQNGQVPKYNSTTQKWENANESGGGGTVTDVQVDGVSVVNQQGVAEITMPTPPTIPVEDVLVNGTSVVDGNKEAQIKSYKEVTQAEYNALPASKLNDDILYCIKDSAGADGFPPLIYSDEEREVGVWRDGKPLYEKTYVFTKDDMTGNTGYTEGRFELDKIATSIIFIEKEFVFYKNADTQTNSIYSNPVNYASSNSTYIRSNIQRRSDINDGYPWIFFQATYGSTLWTTYVNDLIWVYVVRYTKTTDTAGSGTWTTKGVYAHHYSTTEHVVGTWIDGKPLYERTWILTVPNQSGWYLFPNTEVPELNKVYSSWWSLDGAGLVQATPWYNDAGVFLESQTASGIGFYFVSKFRNGVPIYYTSQYTKTTD